MIRLEVRRREALRGYQFTAKLTTRGYESTGYGHDVQCAILDMFTCRKARALLCAMGHEAQASQEPRR